MLSRIYSMDEEISRDYITEYNDKGVDCFVHYEDTKELYLIQCKYYSKDTAIVRNNVSDFLSTPLNSLLNGQYRKSDELQAIFDRAKNDPEYKIGLHFYVSNDCTTSDIENLFKDYQQPGKISALVCVEHYTLTRIRELYFDDRFTKSVNFQAIIPTTNRGTSLDVRPKEYDLDWMVDLRYVMVNVAELYQIYKNAEDKEKNYKLFEENIREYLGTKGINNGIIKTLKDPTDRENFFYYNNGITIICEKCETLNTGSLPKQYKDRGYSSGFKLYNPQIVNGCQTINSIAEVLKHKNDIEVFKEFEKTFVLVKVFVIDDSTRESKPGLDKNIVRYTNSQNSISDKAFASASDTSRFLNLQKEFERHGFLLAVKQSDKNKFLTDYKNKFGELQSKASKYCSFIGYSPNKLTDLVIDLEKFLKAMLAFCQGGDIAFKNGAQVLNQNSDKYKNFSVKVGEMLNTDNMIYLWLTYKRADEQKKKDESKRFPIPFYVVGFLGKAFSEKSYDITNQKLKSLFSAKEKFNNIFTFYSKLSELYTERYYDDTKREYNTMIKSSIDDTVFQNTLKSALVFDKSVRNFIDE